MAGSAGEYYSVTWPGFVGALTAHGHALDCFCNVLAHGLDHLFDLAGRSRRALAQLFDLIGDYAEASPLSAGLRGQYRGIQGEQVRAVGDLVDDMRDLADLFGPAAKPRDAFGRGVNGFLNLRHAGGGLGHHLRARISRPRHFIGKHSGLIHRLADAAGRVVNRLHSARRLLRGFGQRLGRLGDLANAHGHLFNRRSRLLDELRKLVRVLRHMIDRCRHLHDGSRR